MPAHPSAGVGQHPRRQQIVQVHVEAAQQRPRAVRLAVENGHSRFHQERIAERAGQRARLGRLGAGLVADDRQLVAQRMPGQGRAWIKLGGAGEGFDRGAGFA